MSGGSILGGSSTGNKQSSTNTTTNQYDNRIVNDASAGGRITGAGGVGAEAGAFVTNVNGTGNTVTDGGAFSIVDKLVSQLGSVATMQTTVARDLALRGTDAGTEYAKAAAAAQEAALIEAGGLTPQQKLMVGLVIGGLVLYVIARKKK